MFFSNARKSQIVAPQDALPGRALPLPTAETHFVSGLPLKSPVPEGMAEAMFGVGYAGGFTPNPTYKETCTQMTGHNEVVRMIYDPAVISYEQLLKVFWEGHDPTQGMRQGNDVGSTYRSGIYAYTEDQMQAAVKSQEVYAAALSAARKGAITTEIIGAPVFYFAEDYHQQYLAKNPNGYCGIGGTGVTCPIGVGVSA